MTPPKSVPVNCIVPHQVHQHIGPSACRPFPCNCGAPACYGLNGRWLCRRCYLGVLSLLSALMRRRHS